MKRWLVLGAAVSFTACSPDIPVNPDQSSKYSTAEFDPATGVVPSPNDLAFLDANGNLDTHLHVPSPPGTSDAQKEFNDDYLNLLDGFPMESTASVLFTRPIDLSGVNAGTVRVLDITNPLQPTPITTASYSVSDSTNGQQFLNITPEGEPGPGGITTPSSSSAEPAASKARAARRSSARRPGPWSPPTSRW